MQVDRSRFLLLTASLAACTTSSSPTTPDTGKVDPPNSSDSSSDASGGATTRDASGSSGASSGVWLEIEPGTEDPAQTFDPAACDNAKGAPKSCDGLSAPGPQCESFFDSQRFCEAFPRVMQPRAAEAAVDCMLAKSGTEAICDWTAWQDCAAAGMRATCIEPATRSTCMSISSACGGTLDVFQCQQAFAATRSADAGRVASCIQEFCEVTFCVVDMSTVF